MYKNPFNYIGAKYKLLPQILPLFPSHIDTLVDLFGGGSGEVTFNTKAEHYIYNEKSTPLVNIFENLDDRFIGDVEHTIAKWHLSKENKQEFLSLRKYYNDNLDSLSKRENAVILYSLLTHSFNNQISFNSKGEYNTPAGTGRSWFNQQLKEKLFKYIEQKNKSNILFLSKDFVNIDMESLVSPDKGFVYADPPYLISVGAYERDYFCKWSVEYEKKLLSYLDKLNANGCEWALSNVLEHKGKSNDILKQWANRYNVYLLNMDYKNCNYQTKDKTTSSMEVLITNY